MRLVKIILGVACAMAFAFASAQSYPNKSIRILVGFSPGGGADISARIIADALGRALNEPVVVENKPGANGNIAAELIAKAAPDGYNLLLINNPHVWTRAIYPNITWDPIKDFEPVGLVAETPFLVVENPSVKATDFKSLVALAKATPSKLSYANPGQGSTQQLIMEYLKDALKIDIVAIPYKGGGPAQNDVLAGQVQLLVASTAQAMPFVKSGQLKAIAVTSLHRTSIAPDVPTAAELGVAGLDVSAWFGLLAPAGTPKDVIAKLNNEINVALKSESVSARLAALGATPLGGTPADFASLMKRDHDKWTKLIEEKGIHAE